MNTYNETTGDTHKNIFFIRKYTSIHITWMMRKMMIHFWNSLMVYCDAKIMRAILVLNTVTQRGFPKRENSDRRLVSALNNPELPNGKP